MISMSDYAIITSSRDCAPTLDPSLLLTRRAVGDGVPVAVFDDVGAMREVAGRLIRLG